MAEWERILMHFGQFLFLFSREAGSQQSSEKKVEIERFDQNRASGGPYSTHAVCAEVVTCRRAPQQAAAPRSPAR